MLRVAAVVVTYNRKELLSECVSRLLAQETHSSDGAVLDVLVVDNASTDGTGRMVAALPSQGRVRYFNTGSNLGGAGGFNYGMRKAVELGYDRLWVMDDDCLPEEGALEALLAAEKELGGEYGYLSSVVRWIDGSVCKMNVQRHPLTRDIEDFSPALQPVTLASFVSLFVPADIVREVGLPIKDFFIWTDDWEFTRRISRLRPCYLVGGSVVTHASKNNGAGTIVDDVPERLDRYRLVYRNDVVLYRGEGLRGYAYLLARAAYHIVKVLACSKGDKLRKVGIIVSSNIAGLKFHPEIERVDGGGDPAVGADGPEDGRRPTASQGGTR